MTEHKDCVNCYYWNDDYGCLATDYTECIWVDDDDDDEQEAHECQNKRRS